MLLACGVPMPRTAFTAAARIPDRSAGLPTGTARRMPSVAPAVSGSRERFTLPGSTPSTSGARQTPKPCPWRPMFATNGRIGTRRRSRRDSYVQGRTIRERSRSSWKASTAARVSGSSNRSSRDSRASLRPASIMRRVAPASLGTPTRHGCPRCSVQSSRSAIAPVRTIPHGARCRRAVNRGRCCCGLRWRCWR